MSLWWILGNMPADPTDIQRMKFKCRNYKLVDDVLCKGAVSTPLLRCFSRAEGQSLLDDIHRRECNTHTAP